MTKVLDCNLVINEFKIPLRYYIDFRTQTFEKGINHLIPPPDMG